MTLTYHKVVGVVSGGDLYAAGTKADLYVIVGDNGNFSANHRQNKGLPAARNTGLAEASGEYIFHCDSDDFMELDMLESLYNKAKGCEADVVWCDFFLSFEKSERYMKQPEYTTPIDAVKAMLSGRMKFNVWNNYYNLFKYINIK